jgi:membrane protein DedA with SNARE-associated domain
MVDFLNQLAQNAITALNQGNPTALLSLFFISALTEIGIPFPFILDTILIFTGYQHGLLSKEVGMIMLSLLLGRVVGASVIYWLTRFIGTVFVNWISKRYPFIQKRLNWLTEKLSRNAPVAVAIARLTPGLLTPSTVASGIICLRFYYLLLGIAISSIVADGVLLLIGFGTSHGLKYLGFAPSLWLIIVITIVIAGIAWAIQRYFPRRKRKNQN